MILVTVGAQMPFDRMVMAVDGWAGRGGGGRMGGERRDVLAQIGPSGRRPRHIRWTEFLEPAEYRARVKDASLLVAHAGMGSILTALELGCPILVMPRRGDLGETRNDHQVATARQFAQQGRVAVAMDEHELGLKLDQLQSVAAADRISRFASPILIDTLRCFLGMPEIQTAPPVIVTRPDNLKPARVYESV